VSSEQIDFGKFNLENNNFSCLSSPAKLKMQNAKCSFTNLCALELCVLKISRK
jgi:hypothetical protein